MSTGGRRLLAVAGRGAAVAAVAGVALVTAACRPHVQVGFGGQGGQAAAPSAQSGSPAAASRSPSAQAGSSPGVPVPVPAPASAPAAGPVRCTVRMLKAALDAGPSGAGTIGMDLIFTNTSGASCVLDGNPGVKLTGAPSSDQWDVRTGLTPVTLSPGGKAYSVITYRDSGGQCETSATGVLVTPPGAYRSISLPFQVSSPVCENGALEVRSPVKPGSGPDLGPG